MLGETDLGQPRGRSEISSEWPKRGSSQQTELVPLSGTGQWRSSSHVTDHVSGRADVQAPTAWPDMDRSRAGSATMRIGVGRRVGCSVRCLGGVFGEVVKPPRHRALKAVHQLGTHQID